jgi:catechol 2,3-dioxygenase-like lactoylglutathione lyase family enzyme
MSQRISGLHHVTAITADPQKNIDFYCGVLGLRLVKLTVNFDDPTSYHLYYGDELGRAGSIMTFFAWPGAFRGKVGQPQVTATAFSIPADSIAFWQQRLGAFGVTPSEPDALFEDKVLRFADPDGLQLELVATEAADQRTPLTGASISENHAIRGFFGITLSIVGYEKTAKLMTAELGFERGPETQNRFRFRGAANGPGSIVDLLCTPGGRVGSLGAGTVHHVAFRAKDDAEQAAWRKLLVQNGQNVSPVMDRTYFHSIYFREPAGVLFEIATDNPGFTADEPAASLGTHLMLPPWIEQHRDQLVRALPPLRLPGS